jgi:hypothetical protein
MSQRKGRGKSSAEKMKKKMELGDDVEVYFDRDGVPDGPNVSSWINWLGTFTRARVQCDVVSWDAVDYQQKLDLWNEIKVQP